MTAAYPTAPTCPQCHGARTSSRCGRPCLNGSRKTMRETSGRTVAIAGRCTMPTASGRMCRRLAEVQYLRADGSQVAAYCTQHDSAKSGRCWVLRPAPWDYSERRIVADYFPGTDVMRGPFGPSDSRRKSLYVSEGN